MDIKIVLVILMSLTINITLKGQDSNSSFVELETNKLKYSESDTVKLSIINLTNDTLFIYDPFFSPQSVILKMKSENTWTSFNIQGFSGGLARFERRFPPLDTIQINWDQTINSFEPAFKRVEASKGVYKFEFRFWKNYIKDTNEYWFRLKHDEYLSTESIEFEIQ